jgi:hypothetical protein
LFSRLASRYGTHVPHPTSTSWRDFWLTPLFKTHPKDVERIMSPVEKEGVRLLRQILCPYKDIDAFADTPYDVT